jgi:hypothetical protein
MPAACNPKYPEALVTPKAQHLQRVANDCRLFLQLDFPFSRNQKQAIDFMRTRSYGVIFAFDFPGDREGHRRRRSLSAVGLSCRQAMLPIDGPARAAKQLLLMASGRTLAKSKSRIKNFSS